MRVFRKCNLIPPHDSGSKSGMDIEIAIGIGIDNRVDSDFDVVILFL